MLGLSIKEKLYKAIRQQTLEKMPVFEREFSDFLRKVDFMSEEQMNKAYFNCVQGYSNAVSEVLASGFDGVVTTRLSFALMSPSVAGLPDDTGPFVGNYFAYYYYAIMGREISPEDYGKYIRPLNQYQVSLINGVIDKIERKMSQPIPAKTATTPSAGPAKPVPQPQSSDKNGMLWLYVIILIVIIASCSAFGSSGGSTNYSKPTPTKTPAPVVNTVAPKPVYRFEWKEISSSLATRIGYDSKNKVLAITFRDSGDTYYYYEVPEESWKGMSTSDSIKNYFNQYIKNKYTSEKAK